MTTELPTEPQVWLRAFYGFDPEGSGYLGFTIESDREKMLGKMKDGDLVLIYGAVDNLTGIELRRQALGFLEITDEPCLDTDRMSAEAIQWKREHGFADRWTFGIKVRRAWRVKNRVHVKTIAPDAYHNDHRFERTTRAMLLTSKERERALSHPVRQVNVYGEVPIPEAGSVNGPLTERLKSSRGFPPALGNRNSLYEDGENLLYLMALTTSSDVLLGKDGPHKGTSLVKVGRSNDVNRRLVELNSGFPPSAICHWKLMHKQAFSDVGTAHRLESELKLLLDSKFISQGGEFFSGDISKISREFVNFCADNLARILAAPGKATGL